MPERRLIFNGIDAETGRYLIPPMTEAELLQALRRRPRDEAGVAPRGFEGEVTDLATTGWGVIFPAGGDPAVREALKPLLEHRRQQAAAGDPRHFRITVLDPGETARKLRQRLPVSFGPVRPWELPYYLLLVGGPEQIPFDFQQQLSVNYAVGRLAFDTAEEYGRYAESVVAAEREGLPRPRRAVFFGAASPDDEATALSSEHLTRPLASAVGDSRPDWKVESWLAEGASKERLGAILDEAPAVLFTAGHGMGFEPDDPRQPPFQGALLTSDWPGPRRWQGRIPEDFYYAAEDVPDDARLGGLIGFFFACYSAGTPERDSFAIRDGMPLARVEAKARAPRPRVSRLPQRLLAHPRGGALGVVGHVDRAWGHSFLDVSGAQTGVFEATFGRLLAGWPLGAAMKYFGLQYAQLAAELTRLLERAKLDEPVDPREVVTLWTAHNDARAYAVLGDPAVRLLTTEVKV